MGHKWNRDFTQSTLVWDRYWRTTRMAVRPDRMPSILLPPWLSRPASRPLPWEFGIRPMDIALKPNFQGISLMPPKDSNFAEGLSTKLRHSTELMGAILLGTRSQK